MLSKPADVANRPSRRTPRRGEPRDPLVDALFRRLLESTRRNLDQLAADMGVPSAAAAFAQLWRERWLRCAPADRAELLAALSQHEQDATRHLVQRRVQAAVAAGTPVNRRRFQDLIAVLNLPPSATWEMARAVLRATPQPAR